MNTFNILNGYLQNIKWLFVMFYTVDLNNKIIYVI